MSKNISIVIGVVLLGTIVWASGFMCGRRYDSTHPTVTHEHKWTDWGDPSADQNSRDRQYIQFRHCTNCGVAQFRVVQEQQP